MKTVVVTQEMIDVESDSFFNGLVGCKPGDKAVYSDELLTGVDWDLHEPEPVGREKIEIWLDSPGSKEQEILFKKALTLIS